MCRPRAPTGAQTPYVSNWKNPPCSWAYPSKIPESSESNNAPALGPTPDFVTKTRRECSFPTCLAFPVRSYLEACERQCAGLSFRRRDNNSAQEAKESIEPVLPSDPEPQVIKA